MKEHGIEILEREERQLTADEVKEFYSHLAEEVSIANHLEGCIKWLSLIHGHHIFKLFYAISWNKSIEFRLNFTQFCS